MKFLHAPNIKRGLDPPTKVLGPRLEVIVGDDGATGGKIEDCAAKNDEEGSRN